ncbi:hypothetical protein F441_13892 [Phytophthora nicotianae CJ01A1]|uniref:Cyclic nucleotide-binding domain-containing protein n=1 Tax=Phytophthora nicotianae CJ01A1 TaxID=1317063 RepID=W2WIT7_PHYNI|nr:hypothetical protein F441_13892 [Phytophthora nicotianae CJ01A1]
MHGVLAKQRIFQHFSARQRQFLLDHCTVEHYEEGARIIQQGDKDDDRYFILAEGEADVVLDEQVREFRRPQSALLSNGELQDVQEQEETGIRTSVVCRKTLYQGFADEFPFVSDRVAWDQPTSSLSITRAETRRVLSLLPADRSPFEISFVARLLESTAFVDKFDRPSHVDKLALARGDKFLFRQGKIESRAFLILRGNISIVNEDVNTLQPGLTVKQYDVLATLSAGDSFGELSLVTRLQRSASALAACEADLLVLERAHLHALMDLLPGVSVQHAMVQRAEFLASLSFLRDSDFAQCIRVAHDLQDQFYEPRHIFLQEPVHLRSLYIVKSGEVVVYLRRMVPIADITVTSGTNESATTKEVLVRVATIGPQEFFGVAVAINGGIASTATSPSPSTNAPPSSPPSPKRPASPPNAQHYVAATLASVTATGPTSPTTNTDFAKTVFMCSTRVQMLELSERGWRRLPLSSLHSIRNSLLERHRWNLETVEKQQQQNNPTYFVVDKPWQPIIRPNISTTPKKPNGDNVDPQTRVLEAAPATKLARRIQDKKQQQQQQGHNNAVSRLFSPSPLAPINKPRQPGRLAISPTTTVSSRGSPIYGTSPLKSTSTGITTRFTVTLITNSCGAIWAKS